ncbi:glutamate--cysteine ligase [Orbaceae bacterium ESL0721]|nr:glutamate--cysteine ligase [Orbaceae bacterium ESL0721]
MRQTMIPDLSKSLTWLEKHYTILQGIQRGIERETLRILPDGSLSKSPFPTNIGSALTHPWITTDFAESMLEFITPVNTNIDYMLKFLHDLHRYANSNIGNEVMWPLSMPCFVNREEDIILAQYGSSNEGIYKTVYREGLKNRYGAMMQTISGVHYNFSLPMAFWQAREGVKNSCEGRTIISEGYFRVIRNYYRFGWIIPYLFGASPSLCASSICDSAKRKAFIEETNGHCYLPYATSLRLSDIGYTNNAQKELGITFNHLESYVAGLQRATHTKSAEFSKIGVKVDGKYRQLNDNVLQIENEFYAPIRPKRVPRAGELPSEALLRGGIEYIEVRALDINPFSPIGITEEQIRFIDLFLIWCALAPAPEMSSEELNCAKLNWNRIILEGRKPDQIISLGCGDYHEPLAKVGHELFDDLLRVADVLDHLDRSGSYRQVCERLDVMFDQPELTLSAQVLQAISDLGTDKFGLKLANQYKQQFSAEPLTLLTESDFIQQRDLSIEKQKQQEADDTISFDEFLKMRNAQ